MKYTFEVEAKDAELVLRGLGELPAKESMNVIGNLVQQVKRQEAEAKAAATPVADAGIPVQREDKTP